MDEPGEDGHTAVSLAIKLGRFDVLPQASGLAGTSHASAAARPQAWSAGKPTRKPSPTDLPICPPPRQILARSRRWSFALGGVKWTTLCYALEHTHGSTMVPALLDHANRVQQLRRQQPELAERLPEQEGFRGGRGWEGMRACRQRPAVGRARRWSACCWVWWQGRVCVMRCFMVCCTADSQLVCPPAPQPPGLSLSQYINAECAGSTALLR